MPKIDPEQVSTRKGSRYPAPFDEPCKGRSNAQLGDAAGLTQFGVHLTTLEPGAWSSQRHWHECEDEFVYVLEGEVALVEDGGEQILCGGESAGFRAGVRNGHHLINRSQHAARILTVGSRNDADRGEYPDIDLRFNSGRYSGGNAFSRKDGSPC